MDKMHAALSGKQAFSRHLKELMDENKDTQSDLASSIDVQRQSIGYYLSGDRNPGADIIKRIAEKYNVSADWLLGLSKDRRRENVDADDMGIADTTATFIKELDICVKEDIDYIILNHREKITRLLEDLSFLISLASDWNNIDSGKLPRDEELEEMYIPAEYALLGGGEHINYRRLLLERKFSELLLFIIRDEWCQPDERKQK